MPRIETGLAHQLAYHQRFTLAARLFGCALFLAGGVLAASPFLSGGGPAPAANRAVGACGGLLAALGLLLLLGRRGKVFDKQEGTVSLWWGIGGRWYETIYVLQEFSRIVVQPTADGDAWRLSLESQRGGQLPLFRLASESATRAAAAELTGFLGLPMTLAPAELSSPASGGEASAPAATTPSPAPVNSAVAPAGSAERATAP